MRTPSSSWVPFAAFACLALAGCGSAFNTLTSGPVTQKVALQGRTFGGQQPIVGMKVYLYAAGTGGYGSASTSLLTTSGGYVTTDSNGFFDITGDYATCTANEYVYLYGVGGNAGAGNNPNATLMAPIGLCTNGGTLVSTAPYIWMNEVTTVAAAYGLAGWMSSPLNLATDNTTGALRGLSLGFTTASHLVNIANGTAYSTFPATGGAFDLTGTVPLDKINALANVAAACINSTGSSSAACTSLFSNATNGGTAPTDTATAMLNIAHNPTANVATLWALQSTVPPFPTSLSAAPTDWTLALQFTPAQVTSSATGGISFNDSGNLIITQYAATGSYLTYRADGSNGSNFSGAGYAANYSPTGPVGYILASFAQNGGTAAGFNTLNTNTSSVCVFYTPKSSTNSTLFPRLSDIAYDKAGNAWALSSDGNTIFSIPSISAGCGNTTVLTTSINAPADLAADGLGNVWVANTGASNLLKYTSAAALTVVTDGGFAGIAHLAVGASNEVITFGTGTFLTTRSSAGVISTECSGSTKQGLTVDGANIRWMVNSNNILETCAAGTTTASTLPGVSISAAGAHQLATDSAGNLWILASPNVTEVVGISTPTTLPLAVAAANNKIAQRP